MLSASLATMQTYYKIVHCATFCPHDKLADCFVGWHEVNICHRSQVLVKIRHLVFVSFQRDAAVCSLYFISLQEHLKLHMQTLVQVML
jgi:hypothetical protein